MAGKSREELKRPRSKDSSRGSSEVQTTFPVGLMKKPRVDLYVELRILLPNKIAGAIIGRRGENIKRLRRTFLANINLPTCKGPERILTITAELCVTSEILADIIPTISLEQNGTFIDDNELRILLHTRQAGAVIGRKGNTIRELREKTDSKIKVFTERCPDSSDQVVLIGGTTRSIIHCICEMLRTIENTHPPGVNRRYYDPNNFDSLSTSRYGGYDLKETVTGRGQPMPISEKSPDYSRRSSLDQGLSASSLSSAAAADENDASIIFSPASSDPKSSPAASTPADVPSLLSFLSVNGETNPVPIISQDNAKDNENKYYVTDNNCHSNICSPYTNSLPTPQCVQLSGSQALGFPSTDDWGRTEGTISPLGVRTASGPLMDFGASVLQSNRTTTTTTTMRACLMGRLLSAVSCLVSSAMPSVGGKRPIATGNTSRTTLSITNDNDTAKTNSVFNDRSTKPVMTSQIGIPHDLVGAVLGKGNCRLKFMETMTSTKMWIDDVTDLSSDYVINVTGSPEQINCALELIRSVVLKHTSGLRQR